MEIDNIDDTLETLVGEFSELDKLDPTVTKNCRKLQNGTRLVNVLQYNLKINSFFISCNLTVGNKI